MAKGRTPVTKAGQRRVGAKIGHLVASGEVPNTPAGRRRAAGMAYGMEKEGRLTAKGGYEHVKKMATGGVIRAPGVGAVATRPYTPVSKAVPRPKPRPAPRPAPRPKTPVRPPAGELVQASTGPWTKPLPRMAKGGIVRAKSVPRKTANAAQARKRAV